MNYIEQPGTPTPIGVLGDAPLPCPTPPRVSVGMHSCPPLGLNSFLRCKPSSRTICDVVRIARRPRLAGIPLLKVVGVRSAATFEDIPVEQPSVRPVITRPNPPKSPSATSAHNEIYLELTDPPPQVHVMGMSVGYTPRRAKSWSSFEGSGSRVIQPLYITPLSTMGGTSSLAYLRVVSVRAIH